jgi:hypothetical protein
MNPKLFKIGLLTSRYVLLEACKVSLVVAKCRPFLFMTQYTEHASREEVHSPLVLRGLLHKIQCIVFVFRGCHHNGGS